MSPASGTAKPAEPVWTGPLDPKEVPKLRYRLHVRGPGVSTKVELEGVEQTSVVEAGRVRTWCFPGLEANALDSIAFVSYRADLDPTIRCGTRTPPDRVYVTLKKAPRRVVAVEFLR